MTIRMTSRTTAAQRADVFNSQRRRTVKALGFTIAGTLVASHYTRLSFAATAEKTSSKGQAMKNTITPEKLALTSAWDKTFPESAKVAHRKVTFVNRFGVTLAADLYTPKTLAVGKHPAIAVSGPFGAVKEQSSGLYAQTLAEHGWITLAFDPAYTGESGGEPRHMASPDLNTDDFSAAIDFLTTLPEVDAERLGIVGICGWGGMALNAAAVDPRIKATVTSTMYDMSRVMANGYFDASNTKEARQAMRASMAKVRTENARSGKLAAGQPGLPDQLKGDEPQFVKDYWEYYKTPRGFHARSINSNGAWSPLMPWSFINMPLLTYIGEIDAPVLMIHGEKAHSRYFSEDNFKRLTGTNKELLIIPGANHTDLYDKKIPFERIDAFFAKALGR